MAATGSDVLDAVLHDAGVGALLHNAGIQFQRPIIFDFRKMKRRSRKTESATFNDGRKRRNDDEEDEE